MSLPRPIDPQRTVATIHALHQALRREADDITLAKRHAEALGDVILTALSFLAQGDEKNRERAIEILRSAVGLPGFYVEVRRLHDDGQLVKTMWLATLDGMLSEDQANAIIVSDHQLRSAIDAALSARPMHQVFPHRIEL